MDYKKLAEIDQELDKKKDKTSQTQQVKKEITDFISSLKPKYPDINFTVLGGKKMVHFGAISYSTIVIGLYWNYDYNIKGRV